MGGSIFLQDLCAELARAEAAHAPMHSLHEAYAVLLEEVDELWEECRKKREARHDADVRKELLQIAAMAWRAARDLGLESLPTPAAPPPVAMPLSDETVYEHVARRLAAQGEPAEHPMSRSMLRQRLWEAHIPPEAPAANWQGELGRLVWLQEVPR